MIIECLDNQEAGALISNLEGKGYTYGIDQDEGVYVFLCECGCNHVFRARAVDNFDDFPTDAGWSVVTTDELRERITPEDTGESGLSSRRRTDPSLSEMPEDEVLREPTDGDVRVSQGDMWDVRAVTPEWATELWGTWLPEERIPLAGDSVGPRTERHEQTRRLQQEYQRILDEAAERHRSDTEWFIVDDTRGA